MSSYSVWSWDGTRRKWVCLVSDLTSRAADETVGRFYYSAREQHVDGAAYMKMPGKRQHPPRPPEPDDLVISPQPAPDADHEHDWRLAYGDAEGNRGYDCAVPGCPAEMTAGPPVPLSRERPAWGSNRHAADTFDAAAAEPRGFTAAEVSALLGSGPGPKVGDRVQINYGHPDYPGESGIVAEVKPSRIDPETNMVRVTFDVWVAESELR